MKLHIGETIKQELEKIERKPKWLADKIGCDRVNIYDIYDRDDMSVSLLVRISKALGKNLLKELGEELEREMKEEDL
ncbi:MAG: XRE family transcriptional regulator [Bacteroidales bacterium]|nr:XRE family transcriptional regulator [Bacteroidales bacterium]